MSQNSQPQAEPTRKSPPRSTSASKQSRRTCHAYTPSSQSDPAANSQPDWSDAPQPAEATEPQPVPRSNDTVSDTEQVNPRPRCLDRSNRRLIGYRERSLITSASRPGSGRRRRRSGRRAAGRLPAISSAVRQTRRNGRLGPVVKVIASSGRGARPASVPLRRIPMSGRKWVGAVDP
jgi:hypothetical protein